MTDGVSAAERRIEELERHVEALMDQCSELRECVMMLAHGKIGDSRHPYFDWVLKWATSRGVRERVHSLAYALDDRISGRAVDPHHRSAVESAAAGLLDGAGPPELAHVIDAFKAVTQIDDPRMIKDLLRAIELQQMPIQAFREYLAQHHSEL